MSEPTADDANTASSGIRAVPQRLVEQTRAVVDTALDRVFDAPYAVQTPEDFERLMLEHHGGGGPGALASAGAIAAFVRSATPIAERTLRFARVGTNAAGKAYLPARVAKYALVAIPVAMSLTGSARRGVHEIQVLASYLVHRLRDEGVEPDRGLVRALTISLVLSPDRRPQLDAGTGRVTTGLARQWIFRSIGKDSPEAVRARAQAQLAAIDRLDLREVAEHWAQHHG